MTLIGTPRCLTCGADIPPGAEFCLQCGASLRVQARDSVAMDRVRLALANTYPVERRLGAGGMATVYLARDPKHQRDVAVKVLRPEIAAGVGTERFLREIAVAASLQHPHILPLYDSGEARLPDDGPPVLYYVMPYIKGESLRDRVNRETQLPLDEALRITREVAVALDYAHRQGVVHRDIKPENIMLSEGHALVADFGIAAAIGAPGDARITETGIAIGTPAYMSPEQASGAAPDGRSDVYSLGCVLYEMLAGEPPYTGPTAQSVIAKRFSEPVPQLRTVREIPEDIDAAVRTALARVPADRFATAAQFSAALELRRPSQSGPQFQQSGPAAVSAPAPPGGSGAMSRPARRLPRRLVPATVAVLLMVAGVLAVQRWRAHRSAATAGTDRVAIMPFSYVGSESGRSVAAAMVPLLSSVLDGVGQLRTVDPSAVLAATGETTAPDPERARAIAGRLGARRFVLGDVVEGAPGRFNISATAYDAGTMVKRATVEGTAQGQVFRMVNDLAVQLLSAFDIAESPRRLESISTSSIVALNEYLKGESARRRGDYPAAAEAFGRAVAADSLFALAWFRQAYALLFSENPERAEAPMLRARALTDRLSERDRRLADALDAEIVMDPERSVAGYRSVVYDYPDDIEGWFGRADVLLHLGPIYGLAMDSVSQAFERVLALDPHHTEALVHLPWAAALDGRRALVDSATTQSLAADSAGFYAPVWRILRAAAQRDSAAMARAIAGQPSMDELQRLLAVNMVAALRDPADARRTALALLAARGRPPEARAYGHIVAAYLSAGLGQLRAADRELAAADSLDPAAALEARGLLALLPIRAAPDSTLRQLRQRIERWDAVPGETPNVWVAPHGGLHPQLRLYLLGQLSVRLGDDAAARAQAAALQRFDTATAAGVIGQSLAHEVLGALALARGRTADGLAEFDRSALRGRFARIWQRAYSSPFFSQSYQRLLRARALDSLGRHDDALRWYSSLWMANAQDLAMLAPSELGQAQILDRMGRRAEAVRHYRVFIDLWKDADPALQEAVTQARQRVAALQ